MFRVNIIEQNGRLGLIDYEGKIVLPVEFDEIVCGWGDIVCYKGDDEYIVLQDYSLEKSNYYFAGGGAYVWIWDTTTQRPFLESGNAGMISYKQPDTIVAANIFAFDYDLLDENTWADEETYFAWGDGFRKTGKMGYVLGGSLINNAVYDQAQTINNGIGAVRDKDKWYYINKDGKRISEVGYDDVFYNAILANDLLNGEYPIIYMQQLSQARYAYDFSDGLVAVNRDGLWGYMDTTGKEIIPCQFEATRPFYQGKAWVKQNGLWGIISFSTGGRF